MKEKYTTEQKQRTHTHTHSQYLLSVHVALRCSVSLILLFLALFSCLSPSAHTAIAQVFNRTKTDDNCTYTATMRKGGGGGDDGSSGGSLQQQKNKQTTRKMCFTHCMCPVCVCVWPKQVRHGVIES